MQAPPFNDRKSLVAAELHKLAAINWYLPLQEAFLLVAVARLAYLYSHRQRPLESGLCECRVVKHWISMPRKHEDG